MTKRALHQSFRFSLEGLWHALTTERNLRIHLGIGAMAVLLGALLSLSKTEWLVIIMLVGFILSLELVNTVVEHLLDVVSIKYHPNIKHAKDMMAGAVLVSDLAALVIGLIIFIPKIFGGH